MKDNWIYGEHIVSSSLVAPAVRTLVLLVFEDKEKVVRWTKTVLAIESVIVEKYVKKGEKDEKHYAMFSTRAELKSRGYELESRTSELRVVYTHPDVGLESTVDGDPGSNGDSRIVACPWPPEEDEKQLAEIWWDLEGSLKRKLEFLRL